jgi:hypothetical protein
MQTELKGIGERALAFRLLATPMNRPNLPTMRPLIFALLLGCKTAAPTVETPVQRTDASGTVSPTQPVLAPSCTIGGAYQGQVLGAPVFARLAQEGTRVHGRYFYARVGIDLALTGTIEDGVLKLREGDASKPSGTFEAKCGSAGSASSALMGTWTGAKTGAFTLMPIVPGNVQIATKHRRTERKAKQPEAVQNHTTCVVQESWFELFGLNNASIEQRLNRQGVELGRPTTRPNETKEAKACDTGFEFSFSESIQLLDTSLANVLEGGSGDWGGAHPSNAIDHREYTVDFTTGERVKYETVFSKDISKLVLACFAGGDKARNIPDESFRAYVTRDQFVLAHGGVHFYGSGYPHAASVYTGEGPTLSYSVLMRDGYLREDSPVKRAWEGSTAAAKGVSACPGSWGPPL